MAASVFVRLCFFLAEKIIRVNLLFFVVPCSKRLFFCRLEGTSVVVFPGQGTVRARKARCFACKTMKAAAGTLKGPVFAQQKWPLKKSFCSSWIIG